MCCAFSCRMTLIICTLAISHNWCQKIWIWKPFEIFINLMHLRTKVCKSKKEILVSFKTRLLITKPFTKIIIKWSKIILESVITASLTWYKEMETQGNQTGVFMTHLKQSFFHFSVILPSSQMSPYWHRLWKLFSFLSFHLYEATSRSYARCWGVKQFGQLETHWRCIPHLHYAISTSDRREGSEECRILSLYLLCHPYNVAFFQMVQDNLPPHPYPI